MDKKNKEKNGNGLNGSHTDLSLTTTLSPRTISSKTNNTKQKRNVFKFHLFRPLTFYLRSQTCSELKRNEKYKKEQRLGFGGLQGVKFKFVIPHVQVSIKMLQLVQRFCQQDRFGADQVHPPPP